MLKFTPHKNMKNPHFSHFLSLVLAYEPTNDKKQALESSQRPLFPQWSHHVYPQFLPGTHPNHQGPPPQVVIQQQHHQHYHQQMQQQHHLSNANNNYINSNAGMMNANSTANISPILHNNHIINNNHQHLHQTNVNFGGQMLSGDVQNATYYQQHPFIQHQRTGENMIINNTMMTSSSAVGTNGLSHIKNRSRLVKNNGLNNNFYRSSGTKSFLSFHLHPPRCFLCAVCCTGFFYVL